MTALMVGDGEDLRWGIEAERVLAVEDMDEEESAVLPLEDALGLAAAPGKRRTLEIESGGDRVRVTASGELAIVEVSPEQILPLPALVRREGARLLASVIFLEGASPIVVVDLEELARHALR